METQQEIARYAAGFLLLAIGGSLSAGMLGIRTVWIALGLLVLAVIAVLTLLRLLPRPDSPPTEPSASPPPDTAPH